MNTKASKPSIMKYRNIILFALFFAIAHTRADARMQPKFYPSPHISNLQVRDLCQDSAGYIWVATARGLNRYNGYEYLHLLRDETNPQNAIPSNRINRIAVNRENNLWIGTSRGLSLYNQADDSVTTYPIEGQDTEYYVTDFTQDGEGNLWVATFRHGLLKLRPGDTRLAPLEHPFGENTPQTALALLSDGDKNLWIGYSNSSALAKFNTDNHTSEIFPLPDYIEINCLAKPGKSEIWIGTDQGILAYDISARKLVPLPEPLRERARLSEAKIHSISLTNNGKYIITSTIGAYKYDPETEQIVRLPIETKENYEANDITCSLEDKGGNFWFGIYGRGISEIKKSATPFNRKDASLSALDGKLIAACAEDRHFGQLWFGSPYSGLYLREADGSVRNFNKDNHPAFASLDNHSVRTLFCDSYDRIWAGVGRHLIIGQLRPGGFTELATLKNFGRIVSITQDDRGNVWVGGTSGLSCFQQQSLTPTQVVPNNHIVSVAPYRKNEMVYAVYEQELYTVDSEQFRHRKLIPDEVTDVFPLNACTGIFPAGDGKLWLGSYTKGLFRYEPGTRRITRYTQQDGLPSNDILSIAEDSDGALWLATSNGLSRLDPKSERFRNFNTADGLHNTQFSEKAILRASDGRIYIGGNFGVDCFNPADIRTSGHTPVVVFEDLKVQNRSVVPGEKGSPIGKSIAYADRITLRHSQNSFSIDYAGIDYNASEKLRYAYKLEGFDKEWVEAGNNKRASYSNLSPGRYRFLVRVQNGDGEWSPEIGIDIRIKSSPWLTWWAYLLYAVFALSITILITRLYFSTKYNKKSLQLSESQRMRDLEVTRRKIDFYNNISHELRTPLTLINGNLDLLLQEHKPSADGKKLIATISYNTGRLLRLIDQLLDFSRIENDTLELQVTHTDLVPVIRNVADSFRLTAQSKEIVYSVSVGAESMDVYADEDMFEKIVSNLISNAVKYTPHGGRIAINAGIAQGKELGGKYGAEELPGGRYVEFSVSNTCEPLEPAELERMFDRYARLDSTGKSGGTGGTGIGLHYTKNLVTKHKGHIKAASTESDGLTMSFIIPVDDTAFSGTEILGREQFPRERPLPPPETDLHPDLAPAELRTAGERITKTHTLLVVEDDPQIHNLLHEILHNEYNLLHAYDGTEGLRLVREQMPDIVISDVMMPETDGFDLCRTIKNDPQLSHITVILLTAKTRIEEHIEGYGYGADAYINKPFRVAHLQSIIRSHIGHLDRLKAYLSAKNPGNEKTPGREMPEFAGSAGSLSDIDQRFLEKLHSFIDKSIENPDININVIAVELGFSRTSFYRKMKSLTGLAPNDYVRNFKMKKAAKLILDGNLSIAEISDQTGFGTQSHFSTAFKKYFGVSPKDYKDKGKHGEGRAAHGPAKKNNG